MVPFERMCNLKSLIAENCALTVGKCTIFSTEKGKAEGCGVVLYKGCGCNCTCTAGCTVWEEGGYFESDLEHNGQVPCNGALC